MSPDPESMFDFLDDEAANATRARPVAAARGEDRPERALPIIRKPVPVSESGPLRAPSADAPRGSFDEDFEFLGERPGGYGPAYGASAAVGAEADGRGRGRWRAALLLLGLALLLAGAIVAAWPYLPVGGLLGTAPERTADAAAPREAARVADAVPAPVDEAPTPGPSSEPAPPPAPSGRSLGERFRDELERVETLVADGQFDEAERVIATMDRVVYGYGIAEFSALETRIAARDRTAPASGAGADAGRAASGPDPEETARAAEAERLEAERAAERAALDAEAAQREAARREAEQLAAARREAERLADAERRAASEAGAEGAASGERDLTRRERLEAEREAREAEAARARAEAREAARRRAEALAAERASAPAAPAPDDGGVAEASPAIDADAAATTAAAAAAAAAAARAEEAQRIADEREADRRATDRRIAEQRAAAAAEERRIAEQRAAEERRIAALETPAEPPRRAQIDDEDLQIVYASLLELKRAVEDRDIASVISLSDPPSGRVQQLLQIFANSASIRTRITNVSARPADDTVTGTLRIEDIRRADGSRIRTPAELESVALTSTRQGDGWSALSW